MEPRAARNLLESLRTCYPILLLILFILASVADAVFPASKESDSDTRDMNSNVYPLSRQTRGSTPVRQIKEFSSTSKSCFKWLSVTVIVTYLADMTIYIIHVITPWSEHWWGGQSVVIYLVGSVFIYAVILINLLDTKHPAPAQFVCWVGAIHIELAMFGASLWLYTSFHREPVVGDPEGGPFRESMSIWESMEVASNGFRILILLTLVVLYISKAISSRSQERTSNGHLAALTENSGLLACADLESGNANQRRYGSTGGADDSEPQKPTVDSTTVPPKSGWEYLNDYSLFLPYMWPSKSCHLQIVVIACFALLILQRIVNVLVPAQVGAIITALASEQKTKTLSVPWLQVSLFIFYRWLQDSLASLRSGLWIPMSQYSYLELSTATFEHIHRLSLDFHLSKKTGEVLSAMSKCRNVTAFLEQVVFQFIPTLFDLIICIGYFLVVFDTYYALVVGISSFLYLSVTIRMAQWRAESSRQMTNASRHEEAVKNDSIASYETVKHFNAEQREFDRYRGSASNFLGFQFHSFLRGTLLNTIQSTVLTTCLLVACFIAVYQVSAALRPVGQFVTLLMYMAQLQGPLSYFGAFYLSIQSALINAERMLELFKTRPTVLDSSFATPMSVCEGDIQFQNVDFAYDLRKPVLNGLTFSCEPGTTTALVGESGVGKSTIFQLLFRFFNAQNGKIWVDGQDVQDITIDSLRSHISVVSQATQLFNETLMYNLRYASPNSKDEDIYKACKAADIHDKIMAFPDGYNTKVGDRGLRLSGGEKQRVAIARAILKDARIVLLDEATAALDSNTEERIQKSLKTLSHGRTMLVIAHRLSTITTADRILVLEGGQVVESGTHQELLDIDRRYASMWAKQSGIHAKAQEQSETQVQGSSDGM